MGKELVRSKMIKIKKMTDAHVQQVAELEKLCFGSAAWSEKSIASELHNELALWLVAEDDDSVVGYVGSQTVFPETDMMNIAVTPERRREGIAEVLVDSLVTELKRIGSDSLTLEVRASNTPAISLYQKLGFHEAGLRKNYYRNPREDALILRKEWSV